MACTRSVGTEKRAFQKKVIFFFFQHCPCFLKLRNCNPKEHSACTTIVKERCAISKTHHAVAVHADCCRHHQDASLVYVDRFVANAVILPPAGCTLFFAGCLQYYRWHQRQLLHRRSAGIPITIVQHPEQACGLSNAMATSEARASAESERCRPQHREAADGLHRPPSQRWVEGGGAKQRISNIFWVTELSYWPTLCTRTLPVILATHPAARLLANRPTTCKSVCKSRARWPLRTGERVLIVDVTKWHQHSYARGPEPTARVCVSEREQEKDRKREAELASERDTQGWMEGGEGGRQSTRTRARYCNNVSVKWMGLPSHSHPPVTS